MKPETAHALEWAKEHLDEARKIFAIRLAGAGGPEAYLAALAAARALTFELLNKGPKSHKGVRTLMHELVKDGIPIERDLLDIFDDGYEVKANADYGDPRSIMLDEAERLIAIATQLIAVVEQILAART